MHNSGYRYTSNILLNTLSPDDLALLEPYFVRENMLRDRVLIEPNRPIQYAWFPEDGVVSIVAEMSTARPTEVGIFGFEGFAGTSLLLGANTSPHRVYVQVERGTILRIEASRLLSAADRSPALRTTFLRYIHTFAIQTAYSAVSNAHQRIEGRLARWLLMCHDRGNTDEIAVTHEFMSMMISADRSRVTVTLHLLEGAGMIRSKRGRIVIIDRQKLQELAGEHYGRPEEEYRKLIAPFGGIPPGDGGP